RYELVGAMEVCSRIAPRIVNAVLNSGLIAMWAGHRRGRSNRRADRAAETCVAPRQQHRGYHDQNASSYHHQQDPPTLWFPGCGHIERFFVSPCRLLILSQSRSWAQSSHDDIPVARASISSFEWARV